MYAQIAYDFPKPIIFYIDLNPTLCLDRIRVRGRRGEEKITAAYLESLDEKLQIFASANEERILRLDGRLTVDELARIILRVIDPQE
jgi:thymidylate kinase